MKEYLTSPTFWVLFLGSSLATVLLTPLAMWLARAIGAINRGGYRKVYQGSMPLLGGLAVAVPFLAVCMLAILGPTSMLQSIRGGRLDLAILATGCAVIVGLGVVDDLRGMKARPKLVFQTIAALLVCAAGHTILSVEFPIIGTVRLPAAVGVLITVLWIVGLTNAFNLMDGVDGLAAGVAFIASLGLAIIAAANGASFVVLLCVTLAGSLLAFLAFNFHPARVFLGDTGSMFLGFSLATIALMGSYKSQAAVVFAAPILALGLPIFETLTSVFRRFVRGRPLFVGDQGHTHHRLLRKGFSQRQVALTLYAASFVCMVSAILYQLLSERSRSSWIPIGLYVMTVFVLAWVAGYFQPKEAKHSSKNRQRNLLLSAFARYGALALSTGKSLLSLSEILRIARRELELRFLEVWLEDGPALIVSSGRMSLETSYQLPVHFENGPPLMAPGGFAMDVETSVLPVGSFEETMVQSANGHDLIIRYQYQKRPDELERQDLMACLAHLFAQTKIEPPPIPVVPNSVVRAWLSAVQVSSSKRRPNRPTPYLDASIVDVGRRRFGPRGQKGIAPKRVQGQ